MDAAGKMAQIRADIEKKGGEDKALKAVLCVRYGPPESLQIVELPDPVPGPGEVVVEVAAAALNFFDTLIIAGRYQVKPDCPFSPAGEFAGVVVAVGEGVE